MAFFTPIQVLLPQQVEAIDPANKETALAWVTGFGALAAIIANPLAGALSDRTSLRLGGRELGRRHVWTLGGAVLGAAALVLLAQQHTILGVALAWVAAQVVLQRHARLADRGHPRPGAGRSSAAAVSGWVGIPQALGLVLGAVLVTAVVTGNAAGYVAIAVAVLLLSCRSRCSPRTTRCRASTGRRRGCGRCWPRLWISPRRHPDFAWAWGTRFLVQLGNALGTLYLLYFLTDKVRHPDPEGGLLVLILLYTAGHDGHGRGLRVALRPVRPAQGLRDLVGRDHGGRRAAAGGLADVAGRAGARRCCSAPGTASTWPWTPP